MDVDVKILWLLFGVFCFAMEAMGLAGFGLFFAGLGAICLTLVMHFAGTPEQTEIIAQFAWFFAFTAIWTAILWQPIKQYRMRKRSTDFSNIVGDRATVVEGNLEKGKEGKVKWSGTLMLAELATDSEIETLEQGTTVIVKEVRGNVFVVDKL